jgi:endonuclease I
MGRGRAKAKQTKVARELKYHSPNTDLAALQRELGGRVNSDSDDADYADYADDAEEDAHSDEASDDGGWAARRR